MDLDTQLYDMFVTSSPQGTLFCTSWWLDAVAPRSYRILTSRKGGKIQAAWPIAFKRSRLGGLRIFAPLLTPWLGILYRPFSSKLANRLSEEKKLSTGLIEQLPDFGALRVEFHPNFEYWSPLYWAGFRQTTHYTYVLEDLSDLDAIWEGMRNNIRKDIRKAQRQGVAVSCTEDVDELWRTHAMIFERQGIQMPYGADFVRRVDAACAAQGVRKIFVARDDAGDVHATLSIVWDSRSAYGLIQGSNPDKRNSGAVSLVLWEAIQFASTVTSAFDFAGSMMEPVERLFRAFGAKPRPYYSISKVNSRLRMAYRAARQTTRSLRHALRGPSAV